MLGVRKTNQFPLYLQLRKLFQKVKTPYRRKKKGLLSPLVPCLVLHEITILYHPRELLLVYGKGMKNILIIGNLFSYMEKWGRFFHLIENVLLSKSQMHFFQWGIMGNTCAVIELGSYGHSLVLPNEQEESGLNQVIPYKLVLKQVPFFKER